MLKYQTSLRNGIIRVHGCCGVYAVAGTAASSTSSKTEFTEPVFGLRKPKKGSVNIFVPVTMVTGEGKQKHNEQFYFKKLDPAGKDYVEQFMENFSFKDLAAFLTRNSALYNNQIGVTYEEASKVANQHSHYNHSLIVQVKVPLDRLSDERSSERDQYKNMLNARDGGFLWLLKETTFSADEIISIEPMISYAQSLKFRTEQVQWLFWPDNLKKVENSSNLLEGKENSSSNLAIESADLTTTSSALQINLIPSIPRLILDSPEDDSYRNRTFYGSNPHRITRNDSATASIPTASRPANVKSASIPTDAKQVIQKIHDLIVSKKPEALLNGHWITIVDKKKVEHNLSVADGTARILNAIKEAGDPQQADYETVLQEIFAIVNHKIQNPTRVLGFFDLRTKETQDFYTDVQKMISEYSASVGKGPVNQ